MWVGRLVLCATCGELHPLELGKFGEPAMYCDKMVPDEIVRPSPEERKILVSQLTMQRRRN